MVITDGGGSHLPKPRERMLFQQGFKRVRPADDLRHPGSLDQMLFQQAF
ncbi:MAG: hypothetical protein IT427_11675 [Pirellulales bacterium]|nr:hypothetical protein [Pirellulales bacterium]